jgi:hypothetical protein
MNKSRTKQILKHVQYFQVRTYRVCSERTEESPGNIDKEGHTYNKRNILANLLEGSWLNNLLVYSVLIFFKS